MGVLNNSMWNVASGASGFYEHQIAKSVRITAPSGTSSSNGRLTRTVGTVDSNVHFTLNFWIKRNAIGGTNPVASARLLNLFTPRSGTSGSTLHEFGFAATGSYGAGDAFVITNTNTGAYVLSTHNLFRDTSAWYNIHIQADLDNGTAGEKLKIYVNGTEASYNVDNRANFTAFGGMVAGAWTIGDYYNYGYPIQSHLAQFCFIDGTTVAVSSFGETKNGVWVPKDPSGLTFGSEGYLLNFEASGDLGNDSSGNNNDWTSVNLSAHDQVIDSPTFGSSSSGNFPLWSPLFKGLNAASLTEGNTRMDCSTGGKGAMTSWAIPTGTKYYIECLVEHVTNFNIVFGIANTLFDISDYDESDASMNGILFRANSASSWDTCGLTNGSRGSFGSNVGQTAGRVLAMTVNRVDNEIKMYLDNSLKHTISISATEVYHVACTTDGGDNASVHMNINAGHDSTGAGDFSAGSATDENGFGNFQHAPPSGFLALCSANLTVATEVDPAQDVSPNQFFDTVIYTGDGGTNTSITSLNFQPDWLLIKNRDVTDGWLNQNSVSGVGVTHEWNDDGPYESETDCIKSFNSDGWTMSNDHKVNANTEKYVAYGWKKSADAGFDIVEYSGTGSTNAVSHSLGAAPDCIMMHLKSGSDWDSTMYFNSPNMGVGKGVFMTLANAAQATQYMTATSSSTFTPTSSANSDGRVYVAYLFRSIDGYSKFGEFEGNADADGPMVYTGFRPKFVWFKAIDQAENWQIRDTARNPQNIGSALRIYWNTTSANASASTASPIDFLANGFKVRGSNTEINSNTIIYGAVADVPFKYNTTL